MADMTQEDLDKLIERAAEKGYQYDPVQKGFVKLDTTYGQDAPVEQDVAPEPVEPLAEQLEPEPAPEPEQTAPSQELILKAAQKNYKYLPDEKGFVPFNEVELSEVGSDGFFTKAMAYTGAMASGVDPQLLQRAEQKGYKYDTLRKGFVKDNVALLTPEEQNQMSQLRDARPSADALRQMIFFAESGANLSEANPRYFEQWKDEWESIDLTPERINAALQIATLNAERNDAEVLAISSRDAELSNAERMFASVFGTTSIDPSDPEMLQTYAGKSMKNAIGKSLSSQLLVSALKKAKTEGFSDFGELQFDSVRKAFSNMDDELLRDMTLEELRKGVADGRFKSATEKDWAEILHVQGQDPTVAQYIGGVIGIPFQMAKNVPKQMFEYGAIVPVVAKAVLYDPVTGIIKDAVSEAQDTQGVGGALGKLAYDIYEGDPYGGREVLPVNQAEMQVPTYSTVDKVMFPSYQRYPSDEEKAKFLNQPVANFVPEEKSSQFLKEVGDIISGTGVMAAGLAGAALELGQTGLEIATFNEDGYKKLVNFIQEYPLDAAALASLPVAGAKATTSAALNTARGAAAESAAAFDRAYVFSRGRGGSRAAGASQTAADMNAVSSAAATAGVGAEGGPGFITEAINNIFSKPVTRESVQEALDLLPSRPTDPKLFELHAKRVADELAVKALEGRYKGLNNAIKYMDPAGALLAAPFTVSKTLPRYLGGSSKFGDNLERAFTRRDLLLQDIVIQTPDMQQPMTLFDIISEVDQGRAQKVMANDRIGNATPEEILLEVDTLLRESPRLTGKDAWVILPDGSQVSMPPTLKEPTLQSIFGRELTEDEVDLLTQRPELVHQELRARGQRASENLDKTVKRRLDAVSELGLLPDEASHLYGMLDYMGMLQEIGDLPETYRGMKDFERKALRQSFGKRRGYAKARSDAKDKLLRFIKNPKGMTKQDKAIVEQIYQELHSVSHEWGSRRSPELILESIDDFDAVSATVQDLASQISDTNKRKKYIGTLIEEIRNADKKILDIDQYSIDILDRYYRSEILGRVDSATFNGFDGSKLRQLANEIPMTAEQRATIESSLVSYEEHFKTVKETAAKRKAERAERLKTKKPTTGWMGQSAKRKSPSKKLKELREEVTAGEVEGDLQYKMFADEVNAEITTLRNEILESLRKFDERAAKVDNVKAVRLERAQALQTIETARATGGGGSLVEPSLMLKVGLEPQAVPQRHIALAQALALADDVDENLMRLRERAFADNGIDVEAARSLGPDVMNYMRWIQENYFDVANLGDTIVVYSEKPLNMVEKMQIQQLRDTSSVPVGTRLKRIATMTEEGSLIGENAVIKKWKKYKDQGLEPPRELDEMVDKMVATASSEIRTEVFRTTMEAVNEGLLSPDVARLRMATYFPDLYNQYEDLMRLSADEAVDLALGDDFRPIIDRNINRFKRDGSNFKFAEHKFKSLEEKRAMGLIDDPAAVFVVGMNRIQNDIAVSRMFRQLSEATIESGPYKGASLAMSEADMAAKFGPEWQSYTKGLFPQWKKIPGKEVAVLDPESGVIAAIQGRGKKFQQNYGELAGKYVPAELYDDIVKVPQISGSMGLMYQKFLSTWKVGKTALNPATQLRNHVSNWFVADMNGMLQSEAAWKTMYDDDIVRQAWTHSGDLVEEAIAAGLFGNSLLDIETSGAFGKKMGMPSNLKSVLRKIQRDKASGVEASIMVTDTFMQESWAAKGFKALFNNQIATKSYQFGDEFYKLWRYGQIRRLQKEFLKTNNLSKEMVRAFGGPQEALAILNIADANAAQRAAVQRTFMDGFLDYSRVSPVVAWARKGWSPFITFSAEILPKFVERQRQHPIKALLYREMYRSLNNYTLHLDGTATLGDMEEIAAQETLMPDYMKGKTMFAGRKLIDTAEGQIMQNQAYDLTPWHLTGGIYRPQEDESASAGDFFRFYQDVAMMREPFSDMIARIALNRNEWSDESGSLYRTDAPAEDKFAAGAGLLFRNMAPGWMGRPASKLYSAVTNEPYGSRGRKFTIGEALEDGLAGIRLVSLQEPNLEAMTAYDERIAKTPQTSQDSYKKNYEPEQWDAETQGRLEKAGELSAARLRARDQRLKDQFNRMKRLDAGTKFLKSLVK